ncbi:hypothetical protein V2I01_33205 [Micromonospora sp. BRA006-A]|nr:hypothetical protein [Micromonospora sp. BRA006-A]
MRVLFTTFAAKVHMYSQVPLAWALHTAGHEVRIASQPDLADDITHTGLTAVPVGPALNLEEGMRQTEEGLAGEEPPEMRTTAAAWTSPRPAPSCSPRTTCSARSRR